MPPPSAAFAAPYSDAILFNGARYLPARDIALAHGYVRDYVARLCRQGKVHGRLLGRTWYVEAESFANFLNDRADSPTAQPPV